MLSYCLSLCSSQRLSRQERTREGKGREGEENIHLLMYSNQIDCKAGTTAVEQNLLANISTSRASLFQGQYLIREKKEEEDDN